MTTDELAEALQEVLEPVVGTCRIADLQRLSGGANRETWQFDAIGEGRHELILQRDRDGVLRHQGGCALEAEVLRRAAAAGVPVAEVVLSADLPNRIGASFTINRRIQGETIARRLLRDDEWADARDGFVGACARAMAAIHAISADQMEGVAIDVVSDALVQLRLSYEQLDDPHPALELGFRWLEKNRPPPLPQSFVHGDFRMGNLLLDQRGLAAVLDWEVAHFGDPGEDLGWLCVRAWRFGATPSVAGIGDYDELVGQYERASGTTVPLPTLHWWEVFGTLRWGVTCLQLGGDFRTGRDRSVEMATIGRRVVENEYDLMRLIK
ncbi:MAG: phosphotransferase family protein [Acidimicrobiales bacterium]